MPDQPPDPAAVRARRLTAVAALLLGFVLLVAIIASAGRRVVVEERGGKESAAKRAPPSRTRGPCLPGAGAGLGVGRPQSPPDEAVPILMYHVINKAPADALPRPLRLGPGLRGSDGEPADQGLPRRHARAGVGRLAQQRRLLPAKPVVLSFDDGYHGIYARALPVLRKLKWPGTLNLELRVLDQPEQGGLSRQEVRGLVKGGMGGRLPHRQPSRPHDDRPR